MTTKSSKIVALVLVLAMMCSLLTACGSDSVLDRIKAGETIVIDNGATISENSATQQSDLDWVELGQLKDYKIFRNHFDKLFNINIVTTKTGNSKNGCIYTVNIDGKDMQSDNSTLRDAFRNEAFNEYWKSKDVKSELSKLVTEAYNDVSASDGYCNYAILNAYFNLFGDGNEDKTFGAKQLLTREQFYTMVYKAGFGVGTLTKDTSKFVAAYEKKGWNTYYVPYLVELAPYGYLKVEDGSLNMSNVRTSITKLEAIYMITNLYFSDYVERVPIKNKDSVYGYKNDSNMLERSGISGEGTSSAVENNLLAYIVNNNGSKGIDESISKYLKVAEDIGLANGLTVEGHLFDPVNKIEAMHLLLNAYLLENKLYGYATKSEYGIIEEKTIDDTVVDTTEAVEFENEDLVGFDFGTTTDLTILEIEVDANGNSIQSTGGGLGIA